MPRLITSSKILRESVSFTGRTFGGPTGKAQEVRVHVFFPVASTAGAPAPVSVPHQLGKAPSAWEPVHVERLTSAGAPGTISTVFPWADKHRAMFLCDVAGTYAEINLR